MDEQLAGLLLWISLLIAPTAVVLVSQARARDRNRDGDDSI